MSPESHLLIAQQHLDDAIRRFCVRFVTPASCEARGQVIALYTQAMDDLRAELVRVRGHLEATRHGMQIGELATAPTEPPPRLRLVPPPPPSDVPMIAGDE